MKETGASIEAETKVGKTVRLKITEFVRDNPFFTLAFLAGLTGVVALQFCSPDVGGKIALVDSIAIPILILFSVGRKEPLWRSS